MKKTESFINLKKIQSNKNGKTYYLVNTYRGDINQICQNFVDKKTYEEIEQLNLDFGEAVEVVYELNGFNRAELVGITR